MKQNNNEKDKKQMELNFQTKEYVKPDDSKCLNKDLSKGNDEDKVKKKTCDEESSGLFFDNLITVEELAAIFGLAPQTIRNWVAQKKIPHVKIGKRNLFLVRSLQKWLNQKEKSQWL